MYSFLPFTGISTVVYLIVGGGLLVGGLIVRHLGRR